MTPPIPPHAPRDRNPSGASKVHSVHPPPLLRGFPSSLSMTPSTPATGWVPTGSQGVTEAGMEHRAT